MKIQLLILFINIGGKYMSSFYGNLGGTGDSSSEEVNRKI